MHSHFAFLHHLKMPPKGVKTLPPAVDPDVDSPAAQQEQSHLSGMADFELPRTTLIKLAKGSVRSGETRLI